MRRRRPIIRMVLVWVLMAALPIALCLGVSYALSLLHFRSEAQSLAQANARRVLSILRAGDDALARLARATGGECNAQNIALMSHSVFHGVYFREAGIERDGKLQCTSLQMLPPGFTIDNAIRKPASRVGRMEILSPTETIQGGKSLILNWPLRDDRSHFINLLLDPQVLVDSSVYPEGLRASSYLDDLPNGELFRFAADNRSESAAPLPRPLNPGTYLRAGGVYALARADPYPIYTVMAVSDDYVRQHWRTQMQPAVVAGFLLTGLAWLGLRRYLPRRSAIQDLRDGIAAGEIKLVYQPIVDGRDQRIVGAEALARWQHPQRGLIMPDMFIAMAERSGLISPLTDAVLEQVQQDLVSLGELPPGFRISINLARAQLADGRFSATLDRLFGSGATLGQLSFEITERELLENVIEQARTIVEQLTQRGALVSLDDFGTGYSGLSHLRHLSLHHLKIDGSFVHALNTEAVTASLVENIVALAQSLGLGLVAEGVETEAQRQRLLALGVYLQQGWLYAKALSPAQLRATLAH